ncbi:MAG: hypothetical protein FWF12_09045 [Betaproteobacteria bacterium]|nr:hypothetical protein [Betaproteobacteria bacterium]
MNEQDLEEQLNRLVMGLADQKIKEGERFDYDNSVFYAEDVADCLLPSILVLAQRLAERLGIGSFCYRFALVREPNPVFPLTAELEEGAAPAFLRVAPFVQEVFNTDVMACRHDLLQLFESAARLLDPAFSVRAHVSYMPVPSAGESAPNATLGKMPL